MSDKKRIFSGIQPSGNLHLGNYLGAIKNWVSLQEEYESIFCVVDMHAITVPQDPEQLRKKTIEIAKIYLAAGIDPKKSTIFIQSHVKEHAELMWILNTVTKTGELFKMTQFKDKSSKSESSESIGVGLMNYPVLMAADILLYDTEVVPVGEDQVQHIELTRDLAKRFNHQFGETFVIPKAHVKKEGMRIMGLDDPTKKMSKSASSEYNYISLVDDEETVRRKIKKAVTDSGSEIVYSDEKPAIKNLLNIYSLLSDMPAEKIVSAFEGKGYGDFKADLADVVVNFIKPFQEKLYAITNKNIHKHIRFSERLGNFRQFRFIDKEFKTPAVIVIFGNYIALASQKEKDIKAVLIEDALMAEIMLSMFWELWQRVPADE